MAGRLLVQHRIDRRRVSCDPLAALVSGTRRVSTPTFVEHTWNLMATVLTAHAAAMGREELIGPDVTDRIAAGIERVREQPAEHEDLISLIRGFEDRLEAQVTPEVAAAARVARSL